MKDEFYGRSFQLFRSCMRLICRKYQVYNLRETNKPVVYISHHQNFHGPMMTMLWFPHSLHLWALSVFCNREDCYHQITQYPLTARLGLPLPLAKLIAKPLSIPIASLVKSSKAIPVYRNSRKIILTFKESAELMKKGESIVIFPDVQYDDRSNEIRELYEGFLNLERYYYQLTGEHVCFRPLYADKKKRALLIGGDIYFGDGDFRTEKARVIQKIRDGLNELAAGC